MAKSHERRHRRYYDGKSDDGEMLRLHSSLLWRGPFRQVHVCLNVRSDVCVHESPVRSAPVAIASIGKNDASVSYRLNTTTLLQSPQVFEEPRQLQFGHCVSALQLQRVLAF